MRQYLLTPIFKKGTRTDPANYLPISLTAVPCKIMERIIRDIMMDHLIINHLITPQQHGFVYKKSCEYNLLETLDIITEASSRGFTSITVFLDFAKAFDKVSHSALLSKLKSYGFDGLLLDWLSDFLSDRKQRVVIGSSSSDWCQVTSGVPQGSVLGPLLFTLFINDMPNGVHHHCKLFADDTKIIATIKNGLDIAQLQSDIDLLATWANTWHMSFNVQKCKFMVFKNKINHFCTSRRLTMISAETGSRLTLEEIKTEKDLGVYFSSDLKWRTHCQHSAAKANSILGQLRQAFHAWNPQSFKSLYTAFVRPHLEYATSVWNPHKRADVRIIENVQRRATKLVSRIRDRCYQDRLAILNLTTLESRRSRGDLISYYKIANGLLDVNWLTSTKLMSSISCHGPANAIRGHKKRLFVQLSNCPARMNFLNNRVASSWNNLASTTVNAPTLNSFKARLDKHLALANNTTT